MELVVSNARPPASCPKSCQLHPPPFPSSLFVGTFNLNGSHPSPRDAKGWLRSNGAAEADVVFVALQECPTPSPLPHSAAATAADSCHSSYRRRQPSLGQDERNSWSGDTVVASDAVSVGPESNKECDAELARGNGDVDDSSELWRDEDENDDNDVFVEEKGMKGGDDDDDDKEGHRREELPRTLLGALSDSHELAFDLSMGEKPTSMKVPCSDGTLAEWFGYIRLMVFARSADAIAHIRCRGVAVPCPAGDKPSQNPDRVHPPGRSPDKGAVCLYLPMWDLLLVAAHLAGTNRHGVPEDVFDRRREEQLCRITNGCEARLGGNVFFKEKTRIIVAGDLNFRCEVHHAPIDKVRGGRDFRAVEEIAASGDGRRIREFFLAHDRLLRMLSVGGGRGAEKLPRVLRGTVDLFWNEIFRREINRDNGGDGEDKDERVLPPFIAPTFSFPVGRPPPRSYSDKRAPAWTDRILASRSLLGDGGPGRLVSVGAVFDVVISDHAPVYCLIDFT